jgi:hypothetical protein
VKRYVIFNWVDPDDAAAWEAWPDPEKEADVDRHRQWFGKYADRVQGGSELAYPPVVKTLRPGRQGDGVVTIDGPYLETKEFLGGYVEIEAADMDEALAIAREWPSLASQPNATVQVREVMVRD